METIKLIGVGRNVGWFNDSSTLVVSVGRIIQLWNTEGEEIERHQFYELYELKRNPNTDHNVIAVGGRVTKNDYGGYVIDAQGSILAETNPYFAWRPDGETLAEYNRGDNKIYMWHYKKGQLQRTEKIETKKPVHSLDWGSDTDHLVAINEKDNKGHLIDLEEGKSRESFGVKERLNRIAWSPEENLIAGGGSGGEFKVWSVEILEKHKVKKKEVFKTDLKGPVTHLEWHPPKVMLYSRGVNFFDTKSQTLSSLTSPETFAVSPDLKYLATGEGKTIRIFDIKTKKEVKKFTVNGEVRGLDFSPNGEYLACASADYLLRLFQKETDF